MIGSPPFANNLSRIYLNELEAFEFVNLLRDTEYEKGEAYGFAVEEVAKSLVTAYLLLTRPEVRQVYDEETQSVEEQEIKTVEMIPFRVDFEYGILEVFADKNSVSNVINKIGQLTNWETTIETANFHPRDVLSAIEQKYEAELTSVKISNYTLSDSVVGDLSVDIGDQVAGRNLVEEHAGNLAYLGVRIKTDNGSVTVGVYDSGSVVIYNDIDGSTAILDLIKKSAVGGSI